MTKKQTVPLSQIVDHATNEVHPSPNIKAFQTISKIVSTIPSAQVALKVQLIAKMKAYCNKFLGQKETYYCKQPTFHTKNSFQMYFAQTDEAVPNRYPMALI